MPGRDPFLQQMVAARQHRDAGNLNQAMACYVQILAQDSDHAEANRKIAALLQDGKQPEKAFDYWEKALAVEPDDVAAFQESSKRRVFRLLERGHFGFSIR